MSRIAVRGLVKLANLVRRQLAGPITPAGLERLRAHVTDAIEQLDLSMGDQGLGPEAMAPASRRAYEFLKGVDFAAVPTSASAVDDGHYVANVRLPGIKRLCEHFAARLARPPEPGQLGEIHEQIRSHFEAVEGVMESQDVRPEHLKDDSRELRAWLGLLSRPDWLDRYVDAVARAKAAFEREARRLKRFGPPMWVRFVPAKTIYRLKAEAVGTRAVLPTPMIALTDAELADLADFALHRGRSEAPIIEAMHGAAYQQVQGELEALGGPAKTHRGLHHDLAASFDRVNADYFRGRLDRPELVWGRAFSMRKFGHYDSIRDTVMLSATLDRADVPAFVVDFVMFHELLHRSMGVAYANGRRSAHSQAFKKREKTFKLYKQAEAALQKLAGGR